MAWFVLVLAGLCECGWAIGLKYVDGLKHPLALAVTVAGLGLSFAGLSWSLKSLPVGTAYAVWTASPASAWWSPASPASSSPGEAGQK